MQETWVQSVSWEDPLEKEMATHSSILAWKIPWVEEPGRSTVHAVAKNDNDWATSLTSENLREEQAPLTVDIHVYAYVYLLFPWVSAAAH